MLINYKEIVRSTIKSILFTYSFIEVQKCTEHPFTLALIYRDFMDSTMYVHVPKIIYLILKLPPDIDSFQVNAQLRALLRILQMFMERESNSDIHLVATNGQY